MNPKITSPTSEKLQVIDLLRTFSILSVMAAHFVYMPPPNPGYRWLWYQFQENGPYGVGIFFVVSGFLITRLIDGGKNRLFVPRLKEFYVRRVARILPLFILVVLMGILAAFFLPQTMPRFRYCFKADPGQFNFLFWFSLFSFSFNWYCAFTANQLIAIGWGVLWSLSVEEQFYIFYPPVLKRLGNERRFMLFMLIVILSGPLWRLAMVLLSPQNSGWVKFGSFGCFDQIASGALLYFIVRKYKKFFQLHAWLCVLACFSGGGILMGTYGWTHSLGHPMDTVYGASFIALGSFLFLLGGLHLSLFQSKFLTPLAWPGKYSYGIYLLHAFVFYYAYPLLIFHANVLIAFSLFIAISTVVAALSYHLFEVPTNRMIRGIFGLKLT